MCFLCERWASCMVLHASSAILGVSRWLICCACHSQAEAEARKHAAAMETALARLHRAEEEVAGLREQIKAAQVPNLALHACMHACMYNSACEID